MAISITVVALGLRLWSLTTLGLNQVEVAIAADAVALTGAAPTAELFARSSGAPQLLPVALGGLFALTGPSDLAVRLLAAFVGLATIGVTYLIARELYGTRVGVASAILLAVMPYHVLVSRVLTADLVAALLGTIALYGLARFTRMQRASWLVLGAAFLGLAVLVRESALLFAMPFFVVAASSRWDRLGRGALLGSALVLGTIAITYPALAIGAGDGRELMLHLLRQINAVTGDAWYAYFGLPALLTGATLTAGLGGALAIAGVRPGWRAMTISLWVLVPLVAFVLWPARGFTFVAAMAPPLAILLARSVDGLGALAPQRVPTWTGIAVTGLVCLVFAATSAAAVSGRMLDAAEAGVTGVEGGRNAGLWVQENVPLGGTVLVATDAFGDVLQFYGERRVLALESDPSPGSLDPRQPPTDEGVADLLIRESRIQYLAWDARAGQRNPDAAEHILALARRYHGHEVYRLESSPADASRGTSTPAVIVFEVRP